MTIPLTDGALLIDATTCEKAFQCMRAYEYYAVHKRQGSTKRIALAFGDVVHQALEARYRLGTTVTPAVETAMVAAVQRNTDYEPVEDDHRTLPYALDVVAAYNEEYPLEHFEVVDVEVPFAYPLGEAVLDIGVVPIIWTGRIDLTYRRDGRLHGMDHKTTSVMGPGFYKSFELSHQLHGYAWALWQHYGELPYGYTVNAIATRKHTKSGKGIECQRHTIFPTEDSIAEWKRDTLAKIGEVFQNAELDYFPRNTHQCVNKFGTCEYFDVCTLPQAQRRLALGSGDFTEVTWSPLNARH